mgnify:CR=1 FL=1
MERKCRECAIVHWQVAYGQLSMRALTICMGYAHFGFFLVGVGSDLNSTICSSASTPYVYVYKTMFAADFRRNI